MIDPSKLGTSDLITYYGVVVTLGLGVVSLGGTAVAIIISVIGNGREKRRDKEQDRDRVDRWLAEFMVAATDYRVACDDWIGEVRMIESDAFERGFNGDPDSLPEPKRPTSNPMLARLDAARLVARGDESTVIGRFTAHVQYVRTAHMIERSNLTQEAIDAMRQWRSGLYGDAPLALLRK